MFVFCFDLHRTLITATTPNTHKKKGAREMAAPDPDDTDYYDSDEEPAAPDPDDTDPDDTDYYDSDEEPIEHLDLYVEAIGAPKIYTKLRKLFGEYTTVEDEEERDRKLHQNIEENRKKKGEDGFGNMSTFDAAWKKAQNSPQKIRALIGSKRMSRMIHRCAIDAVADSAAFEESGGTFWSRFQKKLQTLMPQNTFSQKFKSQHPQDTEITPKAVKEFNDKEAVKDERKEEQERAEAKKALKQDEVVEKTAAGKIQQLRERLYPSYANLKKGLMIGAQELEPDAPPRRYAWQNQTKQLRMQKYGPTTPFESYKYMPTLKERDALERKEAWRAKALHQQMLPTLENFRVLIGDKPLTPEDVAKFNKLKSKSKSDLAKAKAKAQRKQIRKDEWNQKTGIHKWLPTWDNFLVLIGDQASQKHPICPTIRMSQENLQMHFSAEVETFMFVTNELGRQHGLNAEDRFVLIVNALIASTQFKRVRRYTEAIQFEANAIKHVRTFATTDSAADAVAAVILPVPSTELFLRASFHELLFHAQRERGIENIDRAFVRNLFVVAHKRLSGHVYTMETRNIRQERYGPQCCHSVPFMVQEYLSELFATTIRIVYL